MNLATSNMAYLFKVWIGGAEAHIGQLHNDLIKIF